MHTLGSAGPRGAVSVSLERRCVNVLTLYTYLGIGFAILRWCSRETQHVELGASLLHCNTFRSLSQFLFVFVILYAGECVRYAQYAQPIMTID